jgi:hypothetical protein
MATNISAVDTAKQIADKCYELGWEWYVRGNIFTITKKIQPNNNDDFNTADMEYYTILSMLPTTSPGSSWGTEGGGIGAYSAIKDGLFKMNKSGGSKRVLTALRKIYPLY